MITDHVVMLANGLLSGGHCKTPLEALREAEEAILEFNKLNTSKKTKSTTPKPPPQSPKKNYRPI